MQFDYTVLEDAHFGARGIPRSQTKAVLERWFCPAVAAETGPGLGRNRNPSNFKQEAIV